ncbi:MAG: hypothetical protein KatS3mg035_1468 [Bacteroidia bacterium]|nr:MAG: hypothetical protein KatS3mg035_1468 [Bacteroidia bacterium]
MQTYMQIEITKDGSPTILIPEWNERYHSKNGALQESLYVYIQNGLFFIDKPVIRILEIGLGTGLNVLLTYAHQKPQTKIIYEALEPFPLSQDIYEKLDYSHLEGLENTALLFQKIHAIEPAQPLNVRENFLFTKYFQKVQEYETPHLWDLVYWDAFGPRVQPEMWSLGLCQKIYDLLDIGGIIVTYCSQGQFKRNLKQVGFEVEVLPGPPFKREMTRGIKK